MQVEGQKNCCEQDTFYAEKGCRDLLKYFRKSTSGRKHCKEDHKQIVPRSYKIGRLYTILQLRVFNSFTAKFYLQIYMEKVIQKRHKHTTPGNFIYSEKFC